MLAKNELWFIEEPPIDEPSDLLALPEIRQHVTSELRDDELGLRHLLEDPEALSPSLWRDEVEQRRRMSARMAKRRLEVPRAA